MDPDVGDQIHTGSNFLSWHGMVVRAFEIGIQAYDPTVAAHYWDWTLDVTQGMTVCDSTYYGSSFSDNNNPILADGAFVGWAPAKWSEVRNNLWSVNWKASGQPFVRGIGHLNSSVGLIGRQCNKYDALVLRRGLKLCPSKVALLSSPLKAPGPMPPPSLFSSSQSPWVESRCDQVILARTMQPCVQSSSYSDLWRCIFYLDGSGEGLTELHGLAHTYTAGGSGPEGLGMDGADRQTSLNDPIW